ncbi:MAG TPA: ATP-binding domain-containing protein [Phycisphaerae bacterium]|nr:ATP-binding domain-containing protein [Phycisphaerae bacterium]
MTDWKSALEQAARHARAEMFGCKLIRHVQHAILVTTALRAFGDDARATFYVEVQPPLGDIPRPDLILLHPEIGVLVIENKGIELRDIHRVDATCLTLTRNGFLKEEDPFHQAERVMFRLRDLCKQRFDLQDALFLRTAAFPRIRRGEFEMRYLCHLPPETLFADACTSPDEFRTQVLAYANAGQRTAHKSMRLSKRAAGQVMTILKGTALFYAPRRTFIDDSDERLLGVQIQEMELALKEPTQQQIDLGKADLRGAHRLFRGVAGSGKSIMLALSVAQTLLAFQQEPPDLFGPALPTRRALVVCYNRTLVHYLRHKIEDRYGRIAWEAPADDRLTVTHFEGLIRELEARHAPLATGLTWEHKEERAKGLCAAFDKLDEKSREPLLFDAVYVDEAQDLLPAEIEFLRRLARPEKDGSHTLVLFYDNAQNIYGVSQPTWADLGINIIGRTVFLDLCLRNTIETLAFAFNILVGSFATEGQKVATRQFADVGSLKQRGLITENGDRYDIHFSKRHGPLPTVTAYPHRNAETDATAETIKTLIHDQKVLPSDILILYKSHHSHRDRLTEKLKPILGSLASLRFVDAAHHAAKNQPLIEEGALTLSTIASAKGYDAPIVFLLGVDELSNDEKGRASFYVGATRARLLLYVSGTLQPGATLLQESIAARSALAHPAVPNPRPPESAANAPSPNPVRVPPIIAPQSAASPSPACRHCGSLRLHAQHGRFGYFYRCIDCTENSPMDANCSRCGKKARIRKAALKFHRECEACGHSELVHMNVPLATL